MSKPKKGRVEKHNKWGYIFLIPFILTYVIFQLIPLISTIYNSFFEKNKKNEKNRLHFADYGVTYIDTSVKRTKLRKGGVHRAGEE